jgi:hypothetical protein
MAAMWIKSSRNEQGTILVKSQAKADKDIQCSV